MRLINAVLALSVLLATGLVVYAVYAAATGESCKDRGGVTKLSHVQPLFTGKTTVMHPVYKCEVADERR